MIELPWQAWILVAAVAGLTFIGGMMLAYDLWVKK